MRRSIANAGESAGVHLEMKAAVNRSCASLRGTHKSNQENIK